MKHVRRFGIALLTFVLGIAISPIRFNVTGMGCGKVVDGGGAFSITSYRSSYLVRLLFVTAAYPSPEKADAVFKQDLSEAVDLIELGPKINREGVVIGRRAMATFYDLELCAYYTEIFWTDGRVLHYVSSTSLLHMREFEKQQR